MTGGLAAGWYDDRVTTGVVRWFDGTAWTEHTRPVEAPAAEVAFAPVAARPTVAQYSPFPTHAPGQQPFSAEPSRFDAFGQQPTIARFDSEGNGNGFGGGYGFGAATYNQLPGTVVDQRAIDQARRRVYRDFWLGIGWLLLGALIASLVASSMSTTGGYGGRHYVSTAGVVGGLASLYRARKNYKVMVSLGGQPWSSSGAALAGIGGGMAVLISVISIVHAYTSTGVPGTESVDAGSCWAESGTSVWQVSCEFPHTYVASARISDGMTCPTGADHVVPLPDDSGAALCLTPTTSGSAG